MADCPSFWKPEMSEIELMIKEYNQANRLVRNRIFSPQELSEYFIRMLQYKTNDQAALSAFYHGQPPEEVSRFIAFMSDPDIKADALTDFYAFRKESHDIADTFDVLVERSFRYMPTSWHANDFFTICYCVNGDCTVHFEHETVSLKPGNILIIAPNTVHAIPCFGDDEIIIQFFLRTTTFKKVFWDNFSDMPLIAGFFAKGLSGEAGAPYLLYFTARDEQIDRLLYTVYEERMLNRTFSSNMINGLFNIVFVLLLRNYNHMVHFSNTMKTGWKTEYLPVFQYIQVHYADVTMADLQRQFHYSDRQLNRIVKKCTGKTFSSLILELKMERAKTLLLHKNGTTENVAMTVGYHDVNSFYRTFHSYTGLSPRQWRLRNKS